METKHHIKKKNDYPLSNFTGNIGNPPQTKNCRADSSAQKYTDIPHCGLYRFYYQYQTMSTSKKTVCLAAWMYLKEDGSI
jgi:hypothetical protein